jgi:hypothetical protein
MDMMNQHFGLQARQAQLSISVQQGARETPPNTYVRIVSPVSRPRSLLPMWAGRDNVGGPREEEKEKP